MNEPLDAIAEAVERFHAGPQGGRRQFLTSLAGITGSALTAGVLASAIDSAAAATEAARGSVSDGGSRPRKDDLPGKPRELARLGLQEMSDRLEVQQNLWDYANAVDMRDFDTLDQVFAPEARISYGKAEMSLAEAKVWLRRNLTQPALRNYYHLMGNMKIVVAGDEARSHTRCFNPMEFIQADGQVRLWFNGIWYHWLHVRTTEGWRILSRLPQTANSNKVFDWATPEFPSDQHGAPVRPPA